MRAILLLLAVLCLPACVTIPVPPFGSNAGELGMLHINIEAAYTPGEEFSRGIAYAAENYSASIGDK